MPNLIVLDNRYVKSGQSDGVVGVLPWKEALQRQYETDAHAVCYYSPARWRLTKADLSLEVLADCVMLDIDNPGHADWDDERRAWWVDEFLPQIAYPPSAWYWTDHGARLIYVLEDPVPAADVEPILRGLFEAIPEADTNCCDWTRLYRLPRVVRDGSSVDGQLHLSEDLWSAGDLPRLGDPAKPGARVGSLGRAPAHDSVPSGLLMMVAERLRGRESYLAVVESYLDAQPGNRHETIKRLVGQVVALCYDLPGMSERMIYLLFEPAVEKLDDDQDWLEDLWSLVGHCWQNQEAEELEKVEELDDQFQRVLEGVRGWCRTPAVQVDGHEAREWVRTHAIVAGRKSYYVLKRSGFYDALGVPQVLLAARIRELGMDGIVPLFRTTDAGNSAAITSQGLINTHVTTVSEITGAPGIAGTHIEDPGTDRAKLVIKLFDLDHRLLARARFDDRVDQWLRMLSGDQYEEFLQWIGHSLAFRDGPIAALSLVGPPGCGKKMLATGLAECIDTRMFSTGADFGRFNYDLARSPYCVVNEGWPEMGSLSGVQRIADTFRALTGGDDIRIERKFQDPIVIRNPIRIVIAANNLDVIQMLAANRDLSPEDRDALRERIFHVRARTNATLWLRRMGGLSATRGWIRGDDGSTSDYVLARHFMHLYQERKPAETGSRFLVAGNLTSSMVQEIMTHSGALPLVVEILVGMIERGTIGDGCYVDEDKGTAMFTTAAIVRASRARTEQGAIRLDHGRVRNALRNLIIEGGMETRTIDGMRAAWFQLDPVLLENDAIAMGLAHNRLEVICKGFRREFPKYRTWKKAKR